MPKRTKIVATIGPASASEDIISRMIEGGMNLARINFSHGTHQSNGELINTVKKIREEKKLPVGIIADLQGPRIRILVEKEREVKKGDRIAIGDLSTEGNQSDGARLDKENILSCLEIGNEILIEDGKIKLQVLEKRNDSLLAEVLVPGIIKNRKGVNIPDARLNFGALTEKDREDLKFALSKEVDFVALSFVGNAGDVLDVREKIKEILGRENDLPQIISKIERKEALKNLDEIIEATDAVMVARGDLGIEMEESRVVIYQKEIIIQCLKANKPVIVATQMLDSMINSPIPTRAEVSDVSNAVIDHTDAVMLSGESANGRYPAEAVETMAKIIRDTEESPFDDNKGDFMDHDNFSDYASVINSAHELAKSARARMIILFSFQGNTARMISQHRPEQLILAATKSLKTFHQFSLPWGVEGCLFSEEENPDDFVEIVIKKTKEEGKIKSGDKIVVIMGRTPEGKKMRLIGIQEVE